MRNPHRVIARLIRERLSNEQGFTLMELIVVMLILAILALIALPEYLSFVQSAQQAAAKANVRTADGAASTVFQTNAANAYYYGTGSTLNGADLRLVAPGVASTVKATALNSGKGYCVEDAVSGFTYSYIGGVVTTGTVGAIQSGTCLAKAGTAAS
jgi:type IV pilus assembly protein PilA